MMEMGWWWLIGMELLEWLPGGGLDLIATLQVQGQLHND
jgi:hypothetical protein